MKRHLQTPLLLQHEKKNYVTEIEEMLLHWANT
jgi:hypothetical protein